MTHLAWLVLGILFGICTTLGGGVLWLGRKKLPDDGRAGGQLLTEIDEPIAYCDKEGRIQYSNDAFQQLVGSNPAGATVSDALSNHPNLRQQIADGGGTVEFRDGGRWFDVQIFHSDDRDGEFLILYELEEYPSEETSEQLDQFASLVSHDLRNPLDVALGRTNAVIEISDDPDITPHLDSTRRALHRMQDIITGVLVVASRGEAVGEFSRVELAGCCRECWQNVDTDTATLEIETGIEIEANTDALSHVFENLFRNAIEHGGDDITVRIGALPDGFFVEDDGSGIPDSERARFREPGETGTGRGTGLGLAIVDSITDTHGWELAVTESHDGGARFEFSNVTVLGNEADARCVDAESE